MSDVYDTDHIYVSSQVIDDVCEYYVCDDIINLSDHLVVMCCISVNNDTCKTNVNYSKKCGKGKVTWRWDTADLHLYYNRTGELLNKIHVPYDLLHCKCDVLKCVHWSCINNYYKSIVNCLCDAMKDCVPTL